jgi:hypothetical protein
VGLALAEAFDRPGDEFGRGLLGAFTLINKLRFRDCEALGDSEG